MPTIINLIWTLFAGLAGGGNSVKTLATPHAKRYLEVLVGLAWRGTLIPLVVAIIGILGGMTEWRPWLWSSVIAFAGIVSFLYLGLLLSLATPIGALIGAALPSGQTPTRPVSQPVTWKSLLSPDWIVRLIREAGQWTADQLREGVGRYFSLVRKVLAWEVFIFFFVAAAPPLRSATLVLILGAIAIAISSRFLSEGWARVARVAVMILMAWWILASVFPKLNPVAYFFKKAAAEITFGDIAEKTGTWDKPSFWIWVVAVALLAYLAVRLFKKAIAPAGAGDRSTATVSAREGGGQRGNWLGKAFGVVGFLLCVGLLALITLRIMEWDARRGARIDASMREARLYEEARAAIRTTSSLVAQVKTEQAKAQAPAPAPTEIWYGLVNPRKYRVTLSTNLSEKVPRPEGFSTRTEPRGLRYELWANGKLVPQVERGQTDFPPGTTFIQYRWTNQTPIVMTVGVGKEVE